MDINSTTIPSNRLDASRPPGMSEQRSSASGSGSKASAGIGPDTPAAKMLSISSRITHIKTELDAMQVVWPPFFPIGRPSRIDLIKKIKGVQEDIQKSSIPAEVKKELSGKKLADDATDKDIGSALEGLFQVNDTFLKKSVAETGKNQRGVAIDVKI